MESISKVTLPHKKQVYRVFTEDGAMVGADAVALEEEWHINRMHHPVEPFKNLVLTSLRQEQMLYPVMTSGKRVNPKKNIQEIAAFSRRQINALPDEYKRFDNPHIYKVGISTKLKEERDKLIEKHKE